MRNDHDRRTLETAGMFFTLLFGNLLHFVYDWAGQAPWSAYIAAVNESTWEHMKLLAVPWLVWTLLTILVTRSAAAALPRAAGLLAGLLAIPTVFYTYTGILGRSIDVVNVLLFQAAVLLAWRVSAALQRPHRPGLAGPGRRPPPGRGRSLRPLDRRPAGPAPVRGPHQRLPGPAPIARKKRTPSGAFFVYTPNALTAAAPTGASPTPWCQSASAPGRTSTAASAGYGATGSAAPHRRRGP